MANSNHYSTAKVCKLFKISKSTLFRYEQDGVIGKIERVEGPRGAERSYSKENLEKIMNLKLRNKASKIARGSKKELKEEDYNSWMSLQQEKSIYKFFLGIKEGIMELKAHQHPMSEEMIKRALEFLIEEYKATDEEFLEMISLIKESLLKIQPASRKND